MGKNEEIIDLEELNEQHQLENIKANAKDIEETIELLEKARPILSMLSWRLEETNETSAAQVDKIWASVVDAISELQKIETI